MGESDLEAQMASGSTDTMSSFQIPFRQTLPQCHWFIADLTTSCRKCVLEASHPLGWKHCFWINHFCPKEHPIHLVQNLQHRHKSLPYTSHGHTLLNHFDSIIADQHYTNDAGCPSQQEQQRQQNHNHKIPQSANDHNENHNLCDLLPAPHTAAATRFRCWGGGQTSHRRSLLLRPKGTGDLPERFFDKFFDANWIKLMYFLTFWYLLESSWNIFDISSSCQISWDFFLFQTIARFTAWTPES